MIEDFDRLLSVRRIDEHRFESVCLAGVGARIFGGQALAQCLAAAAETVTRDQRMPSSIHGHFLNPGRSAEPVQYEVERIKDGRSFVIRMIRARQNGRIIATATVTFHQPELAPEHSDIRTPAIPPAACRPFRPRADGTVSPSYAPAEVLLAGEDRARPALQLWLRWTPPLSGDPVIRAGALIWLSDLAMTRTVDLPWLNWPGPRQGASLDHTVWFHRAPAPASWLFAEHHSPAYVGARGLTTVTYRDEAGTTIASAAQECLIRRPPA